MSRNIDITFAIKFQILGVICTVRRTVVAFSPDEFSLCIILKGDKIKIGLPAVAIACYIYIALLVNRNILGHIQVGSISTSLDIFTIPDSSIF